MAEIHGKEYYRTRPRVDFSNADASDSSVLVYKLFTEANRDVSIVLSVQNVEEHCLNEKVKTVLLLHGWTSSSRSPWYTSLKEVYLQHGACNIIQVDWSAYANSSYPVSSANVKPVGEFVAKFLQKSGVPAEKIHLIGHSLGCQLGSFTGKAYEKLCGKKIGRITALDPAGPQWSSPDMKKEERLSELDADFVDVVHTDIQMFGYTLPCGHADFYPNGGRNQPGCQDAIEKENCNHQRAKNFFEESVGTRVTATEIDIKEDEDYNVVITHKENPAEVVFGEHLDQNVRGAFYFKTRATSPFFSADV